MAVLALTNEFLSLNATTLSDHVKSAVLTVEADQLDSTAMGDSWKEITGGLKGGQLVVTFNDDFAGGSVDATLWPLLGTSVAFEVRPDAGVASATNPKYTGQVFIGQHSIGNGVGELASKQLTFPTNGAVTRATS